MKIDWIIADKDIKKIINYLFENKPITWGEFIGLYIFSSIIMGFMALLATTCS